MGPGTVPQYIRRVLPDMVTRPTPLHVRGVQPPFTQPSALLLLTTSLSFPFYHSIATIYNMPVKGTQSDLLPSSQSRPFVIPHAAVQAIKDILNTVPNDSVDLQVDMPDDPRGGSPSNDALLVLLPLLIVLSTFLFLLLFFLVCVILIRRRRGIVLRDSDGPVDMSREELIEGEGGLEGVESRWMESINDSLRRPYLRAKGMCVNHTKLYILN